MHSWILLKQLLLSPSWPLSQQPISPSASWAIDSEPIWARGIIVKYINPFAPGDFAEKRVLKLVEWFSGHCRATKS